MDQLHREHQEIDARLRQAQLAGNLEEARQLLTAALQTTREHFRHEERVAFPLIEQTTSRRRPEGFGHAWMHADSERRRLRSTVNARLARRERTCFRTATRMWRTLPK